MLRLLLRLPKYRGDPDATVGCLMEACGIPC
jgi:hypothetical protein